ncbi:MAG TPA: hypothetical protein PLR88_06125 [Bacteroidales bacterium]|nr:hypothetical protein [Bacteroidales bacterium]HPT21505.1 hypothetical protein [Bacteroidales bacterium]
MGLTSTHFVTYRDINVKNLDLFEEAWGINNDFHDVTNILRQIKVTPSGRLTKKMIEKVRKQY